MIKSTAQNRRPRRGVRLLIALLLVLALAAAGLAGVRAGLDDPVLEALFGARKQAAPTTANPAAIAPPPSLELPPLDDLPAPKPVARPAKGPQQLSADAIANAIEPQLGSKVLGKRVLAAVAPLSGDVAYSRGPATATPASTTKVITSAAALLALGPDRRFATSVRSAGGRNIVLVGGGDPYLADRPQSLDPDAAQYPARADIATLARQAAATLKQRGRKRVKVYYEAEGFPGPSASPQWRADYVPDGIVAPISSLMVNGGRPVGGSGRVSDPPATAAALFTSALSQRGIRVEGTPGPAGVAGVQVRQKAEPLAVVQSAPLDQIVERILDVSDNEASEVLLRHVGIAAAGDGSFTGGQQGVRDVLAEAGVILGADEVLYDGSGLSRLNRLAPQTLVSVLQRAAAPGAWRLRAILTGIPVAGFTGSLTNRFDLGDPDAPGRVRAKTGTLTNVFSLAGIAQTESGETMVFALMADRIKKKDTSKAQVALDNAAAELGACVCG